MAGMWRVLVLAAGAFALGINAYVMAGLLPALGADVDVSVAAAGQLVTAFTLTYALFSPVLAAALARVSMRTAMVGALAVFAAANLASTAVHSLTPMLATRAVAGVAAGVYAPLASTAATHLLGPARRGLALSTVMGAMSVGAVFGVPIGLLLADSFGWRWALWLVSGIALATVVGIALVIPPLRGEPPPVLSARIRALADRRVAAAIGLSFLVAWSSLGAYTYAAPLLSDLAGVTELLPYLFCWGAGGALSVVLVGALVDRGYPVRSVVLGIVAALGIALMSLPLAGSHPLATALVVAVWGGAGWSLQVPQQHRLLSARPEQGTVLVALNGSALYLGAAVGAAVGGPVLALSGSLVLILGLAGVALAALALEVATNRAGRSTMDLVAVGRKML